MKILVTGHTGFVGKHLLAQEAHWRTDHAASIVTLREGFDITSHSAVEAGLLGLDFDHVIHLAAQSNVPQSFKDPASTFDVNTTGTVRLLHVLQRRKFSGRLLYISSGDVYGLVEAADLPVSETTRLRPANPYGASKIAAEIACLTFARSGAFDVLVARPFNHLGAGQSTAFSVARFANELARIKLGLSPPTLLTGPLDVTRDFLDVRDVLSAYMALLISGRNAETYNVCSGVERELGTVLAELIALSGLEISHAIDPTLARPVDLPRMVGDATKLRSDTGWSPKIPFSETLRAVFLYFLEMHQR
jgi:GDP-4-dehydro-6-deoxy-D-mannose reductase